jgi:hypothetical protein
LIRRAKTDGGFCPGFSLVSYACVSRFDAEPVARLGDSKRTS